MLSTTVVFLLACGEPVTESPEDTAVEQQDGAEEEEEEVEDTGQVEEVPGNDVFELPVGSWVITDSEVLSDECDIKEHVDQGAPGSVLVVESGGESEFFLRDSDGGADRCVLSGRNFLCDASEAVDDTARSMGFNADIHYETSQSGTFSTASTLSLQADVDLNCVGSDCGFLSLLLGSFPCNLVLGMELSPM